MIYVDANVVIRLIEGDIAARSPLEARLKPLRGTSFSLLTSQLTRLECRIKPIRGNDTTLLALYDKFFAAKEIQILELTADVIETINQQPSYPATSYDSSKTRRQSPGIFWGRPGRKENFTRGFQRAEGTSVFLSRR